MAISARAKPKVNKVSADLSIFAGGTAMISWAFPPTAPFLLPMAGVCGIGAGILRRIAADPPRYDFAVVTIAPGAELPPLPITGRLQRMILADFLSMDVAAAAVAVTLDRIEALEGRGREQPAERDFLVNQRAALVQNLQITSQRLATLSDSIQHVNQALDETQEVVPLPQWQEAFARIGFANPILEEWVPQAIALVEGTLSAPRPQDVFQARNRLQDQAIGLSRLLKDLAETFSRPDVATDIQ